MSAKNTTKPFLLILFITLLFPLVGQGIDMDDVNAKEDFRWGVIAYNDSNYNDSIRSLERALALKPENLQYQEWLGSALFRAGFTGAAMEIWESVLTRKSDPLLNNRVELSAYRQGVGPELAGPGRFVVSGIIEGRNSEYSLFKRPSSIFPMDDGGFYLSGFGSNEVFYFDVNGALKFGVTGGLAKLASPFDVHYSQTSGYLYISEFNGHRIFRCNKDGTGGIRFGERGRGDGQLLGPQYIAEDDKGYLYVTDYGNHRVVKFDTDGNYILTFGEAVGSFSGLREPTGITASDGMVFVADARGGFIAVFDYSGNYLTTMGANSLVAPEGLSPGKEGELLLADGNKVFSFDINEETLEPLADLSGSNVRIMKAVRDINGNIISVDFDNSRISFLTDVSEVYTGLSIQIDRISSDDFPRVLVDLTVEDPMGNPIVGLTNKNFYLTELSQARYMIDDYKLVYRGNSSQTLNTALVIDREPGMADYGDDIKAAVGQLYDSVNRNGSLRVITAAALPVIAASAGSSRNEALVVAAGDPDDYTSGGRFDLSLRLAAGDIINGRGYKSIVYITRGKLGDSAFNGYSVLDTSRYFKNNGISFNVIYVSTEDTVSPELKYLCEETGGEYLYLYQPEGLTRFLENTVSKPNGTYTLEYTSRAEGDFGRRYIPFQAEVLLYNRSGRERSGYFPPAEY
ncbi:MAG: hypothetical protein JEY99_13145 [Spirochaetales bacterium]|nr:hypothetical protein [Spirochaetales bacterium]